MRLHFMLGIDARDDVDPMLVIDLELDLVAGRHRREVEGRFPFVMLGLWVRGKRIFKSPRPLPATPPTGRQSDQDMGHPLIGRKGGC